MNTRNFTRITYYKKNLYFILFFTILAVNIQAQVETFMTDQGATNSLVQCEGFFYDDGGEDEPYDDMGGAKTDILTFCPATPSQQVISINFQMFDVAPGDRLTAFNGKDTLANQFNSFSQGSGSGPSVADAPGGSGVTASCDNVGGCVTFAFYRNGDETKGAGFKATVECVSRNTTKLDCKLVDQFNGPGGRYFTAANCRDGKAFVRVPIPSFTDCGRLGRLNVSSSCTADFPSSVVAIGTGYIETYFPIGEHTITFASAVYPDINCVANIKVISPGMGCNDNLNLSLSNQCIATITPELMLEGDCTPDSIIRPTDGAKVAAFFYEVELIGGNDVQIIGYTMNGYPIADFSNSTCGTRYDVKITRKYIADTDCDGQLFDGYNLDDEPIADICEGQIVATDKVAPRIVAGPEPIAIPCYEKNQDPQKLLEKLNKIDRNLLGLGGTLNLPLSNSSIEIKGKEELEIIENCFIEITASAWEYVAGDCEDNETVKDVYGNDLEASIFGFYRRVFSTKDRCGNEALKDQIIYIYQPDIVAAAPEIEVPCGTDIDPEILRNDWLAWVTAGRPANDPRQSYAAYLPNFDPTAVSLEWYDITDSSGDEVPLDALRTECGYAVDWSDSDTIYTCGGSFKIFRTWTIYDWCDGILELTNVVPQVILVGDKVAPEIVGNQTYEIAGSPALECSINVRFNKPVATDDCTGAIRLSVRIGNQEKPFLGNTLTLEGLPIGEEVLIEWIAKDDCGNTKIESELKVFDDVVAPTAICETQRTVSLGTDCTAIIPAESFDDGSFDNCGTVSFSIARARGDETPREQDFKSVLELSINDLAGNCDQQVAVVFRVTDGSGNVNFCTASVTLQDKLPPFTIPSADTISCDNVAVDELLQIKSMNNSSERLTALADLLMGNENMGEFNGTDNCSGAAQMTIRVLNADFSDFDGTCRSGKIAYNYRLVDGCGNSSNRAQNSIVINANSDWTMTFPIDLTLFCEDASATPAPSTIDEILTNNGCDFWGLEVGEEFIESSPDACQKIIYTYNFINWCNWSPNNTEVAIIERPDTLISIRDKVSLRFLDENNDGINDIDDGDEDHDNIYIYTAEGPFEIRDVNEASNFDIFDVTNAKNDGDFVIIDTGDTPYGGVTTYNLTSQFSGNTQTYVSAQDYGNIAYRQIVKIIDTTAPVVDISTYNAFCGGDTQVNNGDACTAEVEINFSVSDLCTATENIQLSYQLKAFGESATNDVYGNLINNGDGKFTIKGRYPLTDNGGAANHIFVVRAEDGCSNTELVELPFEVKDCKAPSVYCRQGLSARMLENGEIALWASDFDAGSVDFCTAKDQLRYTLADPNLYPDSTSRTYRCENGEVGAIVTSFWVQDLAGNVAFCETFVNITPYSENGGCNGENFAQITGLILTEEDGSVMDAEVHLSGSTDDMKMTNESGSYAFDNIEMGYDYSITPTKNDDHLEGISTFDMILISKHILSVEFLDSPYKRIAADVNNSGAITTSDMVALRKMILGQADGFDNNTSWRFVAKDYVFLDPENPLAEAFPEDMSFNDIETDMENADFVGIKVGDVNGSVNNANDIENRDIGILLSLQTERKTLSVGEVYALPLIFGEQTDVEGFQMTLQFDPTELRWIKMEEAILKSYDLGIQRIDEGLLLLSWIKEKGQEIEIASLLANFQFEALKDISLENAIQISDEALHAEVYFYDGTIAPIELNFKGSSNKSNHLYQNNPNPFSNQTNISFELADTDNIELEIYSATGQLIYLLQKEYEIGKHQIIIDGQVFNESGIYYYHLKTAHYNSTRKMIFTK